MKHMLGRTLAVLTLLLSATLAWGHDPRLHGANALTGQVVSASADGMELKVKNETVKVKFSSKTKFEHDNKAADKSHLKAGDRAGVVGNKLPSGEWMASTVIMGLHPPAAAGAKPAEHK